MRTDILQVFSRKLAPFILLFGFYVVCFGHLSPGGGFQGGVVLASGFLLLLLCREPGWLERIFPLRRLVLLEAAAFLLFLLIGLAGIAFKKSFLGIFLPVSDQGEIPSAGFILALNLVIAVEVGAGISLVCAYLYRQEQP